MPVQAPEDFIQEFLVAHSAQIKRELADRAPFRRRFFSEDCLWDSREAAFEDSQAEAISGVSVSESGVTVTTRAAIGFGGLRYHLRASGESWLIFCVEFRCPRCASLDHGKGADPSCRVCSGRGWVGRDDPTGSHRGQHLPRPRRF